ncbi:unnamed protein product [Gulo gulo]|uniref:Uncharacterized protein n=1 Tax=Gulo gulo TaxID=48420 RepID=A0A9X9PYI0_GULGU|nr:unnamed protein product [Gulo gulo]
MALRKILQGHGQVTVFGRIDKGRGSYQGYGTLYKTQPWEPVC